MHIVQYNENPAKGGKSNSMNKHILNIDSCAEKFFLIQFFVITEQFI